MAEQDLTCCGSTNWATFNVHVHAFNVRHLYVDTMHYVHKLDHLADFADAVEWYETIVSVSGGLDEFGHRDGERQTQIDFEDLAGDLRAEQDIEYLLDMEYTTLEEVEEAGLSYEK